VPDFRWLDNLVPLQENYSRKGARVAENSLFFLAGFAPQGHLSLRSGTPLRDKYLYGFYLGDIYFNICVPIIMIVTALKFKALVRFLHYLPLLPSYISSQVSRGHNS